MNMLAELQKFLRAADAGRVHSSHRVDVEALRARFLDRLRPHESVAEEWVRETYAAWSSRLEALAYFVESQPRGSETSGAELTRVAVGVLDTVLDLRQEALAERDRIGREVPVLERLEFERLAAAFSTMSGFVPGYADACRLTRTDGVVVRPTALGRTLLTLRGADAIRWLLLIETELSTGFADPWRAPRALFRRALEPGGVRQGELGEPHFVFHAQTLKRLGALGALTTVHGLGGEPYCYRVSTELAPVVRSVVEEGPWHGAVRALLEDDRNALLRLAGPSASDAGIEQTRMLAHEVRNALVPVRHQLDTVLGGVEATHASRIGAARRGVVRVLAFVDEMVTISELVAEPLSTVDIVEALREAVGWTDAADRFSLQSTDSIGVAVRAPRSALVRAVVNILRNAIQATPDSTSVRVSVAADSGSARIVVDDAGPGVPVRDRSRIFDDGYTTRHGGMGFGLAYARKVLEGQLQGRVWCEESELGGARFVVVLPAAGTEP